MEVNLGKKGRSRAYICTISMTDPGDLVLLEYIKGEVAYDNVVCKSLKVGDRHRVSLKHRLGRNSPFRDIYRNRTTARFYGRYATNPYQSILKKHAAYTDVYVHRYYPEHRARRYR